MLARDKYSEDPCIEYFPKSSIEEFVNYIVTPVSFNSHFLAPDKKELITKLIQQRNQAALASFALALLPIFFHKKIYWFRNYHSIKSRIIFGFIWLFLPGVCIELFFDNKIKTAFNLKYEYEKQSFKKMTELGDITISNPNIKLNYKNNFICKINPVQVDCFREDCFQNILIFILMLQRDKYIEDQCMQYFPKSSFKQYMDWIDRRLGYRKLFLNQKERQKLTRITHIYGYLQIFTYFLSVLPIIFYEKIWLFANFQSPFHRTIAVFTFMFLPHPIIDEIIQKKIQKWKISNYENGRQKFKRMIENGDISITNPLQKFVDF